MSPINWPAALREPIVRGLLLSAGLHLAALALIQPSPGSGTARTVVINARLEVRESPPAAKATSLTEHPEPRSAPLDPAPPVIMTAREALTPLTSQTPSPTPAPVPAAATATSGPATSPSTAAGSAGEGPPTPSAAASAGKTAGPATPSALPSLPLGIDTTWYRAIQVDVHPKAIGKIEPPYPEDARRRGIEGTLKLMVKIDDLGRVQSVEVVESNRPGVFDEAALETFAKARFHPAMKDGRPVRYQAYMRVDFKLED